MLKYNTFSFIIKKKDETWKPPQEVDQLLGVDYKNLKHSLSDICTENKNKCLKTLKKVV